MGNWDVTSMNTYFAGMSGYIEKNLLRLVKNDKTCFYGNP